MFVQKHFIQIHSYVLPGMFLAGMMSGEFRNSIPTFLVSHLGQDSYSYANSVAYAICNSLRSSLFEYRRSYVDGLLIMIMFSKEKPLQVSSYNQDTHDIVVLNKQ